MWQDGQDLNEDGIPVRLYQPILYSKRTDTQKATVSHIGGSPTYFASDSFVTKDVPHCTACDEEMNLLLQLYNPELDRTLYVFGCNRGACVASAFSKESQFSMGGGGRFVCRHSQPSVDSTIEKEKAEDALPAASTGASPWGAEENEQVQNDDDDDDWNVTDAHDDNIDDVEAMVAAMEMKGLVTKAEKTKPVRATKQSTDHNTMFACFEIHGLQEPASLRKSDDMDEDDVGIMGGSADDKKIQQMLARYMMEEEDPDILAAIQGAGSSGGGREKDEQLPAEDRAMLAFTDRVKRSPRQIVRYAPGGVPLWSVPVPKNTINGSGGDSDSLNIPNCPSCGSERQFECQLMPNLLGVLDVDKHARKRDRKSTSNLTIDELMSREYGGMNWGALAVYTCIANCVEGREDYVIVQDSIDGTPEKRVGATDDAMVSDADKKQEKCFDDDMMDDGDESE